MTNARAFVTVAAPATSGATSAAADYGPVSAALRPEVDDLRALTAVIDTSAQRAESALFTFNCPSATGCS
jgi:hypothetical protein